MKERKEGDKMVNAEKFREVCKRNNKKFWEVSSALNVSPQALYNKLGNTSEFKQSELDAFRELFPDVSEEEFKQIFTKGE